MTAPRGTAALLGDLERKVAGQEERIRALSERLSLTGNALIAHSRKVNEMTDALMEAFRYAGVHYPVPRHLRAVGDAQGSEPGAVAVVRHVTPREGS